MFAIIETGGKQYKVSVGNSINIEKLSGEYKEGDKVVFDKVLLIDDGKLTQIGKPFIEGAKIEATFEGNGKAKKVIVIRFRSKSRHFTKNGHRQPYTKVAISKI